MTGAAEHLFLALVFFDVAHDPGGDREHSAGHHDSGHELFLWGKAKRND
jgi:hypothetical protein